MCEFCENSEIICDGCIAYGYSMHTRETILSNRRVLMTKFSTRVPFENDFQRINFEVNFCPICGRDLRSEENE